MPPLLWHHCFDASLLPSPLLHIVDTTIRACSKGFDLYLGASIFDQWQDCFGILYHFRLLFLGFSSEVLLSISVCLTNRLHAVTFSLGLYCTSCVSSCTPLSDTIIALHVGELTSAALHRIFVSIRLIGFQRLLTDILKYIFRSRWLTLHNDIAFSPGTGCLKSSSELVLSDKPETRP